MNPNWHSFLESTEAHFDEAAQEVLHFEYAKAAIKYNVKEYITRGQ